jgi:outer membrane immunogenic protein
MPVKAPVYKAPPSAFYSWTGCYLGVHAGAGAMYDQFTSINGRGALAGGQLGCNYQSGVLVAGIEAEGWSGLQSRLFQSQTIGGVLVASAETTVRNRWDAAVALRGGFAIDRALLYSKVGVAWGGFDFALDFNNGTFQRGSSTMAGLLVGTGLEYAFLGNWTAKIEYNYIGYLGSNVHVVTDTTPFDTNISATKHIVKTGINYKFGDPVAPALTGMPVKVVPVKAIPAPAYDWTGCYVGLHAGGGVLFTDFANRNGGGALAGGQAGCNLQNGRIVVGIEAEGWWSGLVSIRRFTDAGGTDEGRARNRWDADVALRAGLAVDRALIYAKAGVAAGEFDFGSDTAVGISTRGSGRLSGLLVGTGLEYAFDPGWSGKLEYNYIGFAGRILHFVVAPAGTSFDETQAAQKHIVKAGINYHFGPAAPIISKY